MTEISNRILIAEDHHVTRHLLERTLDDWGFDVVAVADGRSALDILESEDPPPVAILDVIMPEANGLDICADVRQRQGLPYVYIMLLTALTKKVEIAAGLEAGADDYVSKPFDYVELRARVKVGQRVAKLERNLQRRVEQLQTALADVKKLKRLLPICMYCKSIRDDQAYWHTIEKYIHVEAGTDFSHGICPNCMAKVKSEGWM